MWKRKNWIYYNWSAHLQIVRSLFTQKLSEKNNERAQIHQKALQMVHEEARNGLFTRSERQTLIGQLKINKALVHGIRTSNLLNHLGDYSDTVRRIARASELQETKFEELLQIVLVFKEGVLLCGEAE